MACLISSVLFSHLVFDEGYNLQVPLLLHTTGAYSTFDSVFDNHITTGWPVLLPAALLVHFSWWAPRLVILIYTLVLFWLLVRHVYASNTQYILFLITFSLIPLSFLFSTHVLGELPAFVWMTAGYIFLVKRRFQGAGVCIGLAVVTKNSAVFALAPVALSMIISDTSKRISIRDCLRFITSFFIPIMFGEILRFSALGSVHAYMQNVSDYLSFAHSQTYVHLDLITNRLKNLGEIVGFSPWLLILFLMFAFIGALRFGTLVGYYIALYGISYGLYYLFLGPNSFYRPFFPVLLSAVVCLPFWNRSRLGFFVIVSVITVLCIGLVRSRETYSSAHFLENNSLFIEYRRVPIFVEDTLLKDQLDIVHILKDKTVSGIGWHNAPELSYLLDKQVYRDYSTKTSCYIITGYIQPLEQEEALRFISTLYYKNTYYRVYKKNGC
ncbi:hypothetical protein COU88_02460 [Candidatus Roizmanbacteria bacterium CG10_big_fil_rev_8_21_14_0_10_39_6]|uniref:Glycosyltransferase RgtA/B/C/D-like domain-containing protein n=1 Tax=Candidatus Roizmanbacteria bacterium CG10_big_fil_rev_8_21_14_0_10_39_6 TaxID=1974853 RepID=A0A2M8KSM8_9BACT|nr:MAG: hypothetical protein COU88_02460 [Candidatus Roizmanbacteria bacterium CG10_big_fil_rev_8_21_14_0_10_39_6]